MSRKTSPSPGRLLVVDDNKVNRLLLGRDLEQQGHTVCFAENGRQALEMVRNQPFDIILLDIQMPEMDGYQVLEQITSDIDLRAIPVIMTTATEELDSVVKCIELGAEDYLTKPVNQVLVRARVNASLEKKRLRDQQRELIKKFATAEVAEDLQESGFSLGGRLLEATTMFSDIRGFTTITEYQSPADIIDLLNTYYILMFEAISGHSGVVNQMVGDGLMAIFGAPLPLENRQEQAVRAAQEMIEMVDLFNLDQTAQGKTQIKIGIGIASGAVIAGYTGTLQRATYTCVGDTVNLAARLEAYTKEIGQPILIDEATRLGLSSNIAVKDQGVVQLKGKIKEVKIFSVPVNQ
ncbi:MAG: response regulator [Anaerolineales bacterium]